MGKADKILLCIIIILIIVLIIASYFYLKERKTAQKNMNIVLDYAMDAYDTHKEISSLQMQIMKSNFNINEIEILEEVELDVERQEIAAEDISDDIFNIIDNTTIIREGFELEECYANYGKKSKFSTEYDELDSYILNFKNRGKKVTIYVNENEELKVDKSFPRDAIISKLDGNTFTVFHYENQYMIFFTVKNKNFYIETVGLTEERVLDLMDSIF